MSETRTLIDDVKRHLKDNDGELVYWGEPIALTRRPAVVSLSPVGERVGVRGDLLDKLRSEEIGDCHLCPLGDTRIKLVFGVGNAEAQVMFVGEGPGFDEDRQGEPFVGRAGQLLDKIMGAIGLDRSKVYIANIVKCHPMVDPSNPDKRGNDRPPLPEEMEKCIPFLKKQIAIIRPKIVVTLGATSSKALLQTTQGITALRGKLVDLKISDDLTVKVLPTFHPAALLRDPELKKPVWEDMKLLRSLI